MTHRHPSVRAFAFCALLIVASLVVAACGSSSSSSGNSKNGNSANVAASSLGTTIFGAVPPKGTPVSGGTITQGQLTGQTPTEVFPLANSSTVTTGTISFNSEMYMPLYSGPIGAQPKIYYPMSAAAGPPVPSNGDKTYTIHLKSGLKWSDGQPLTAKDVLFSIAILKAAVKESPANWGQYVPGQFPTSVVSDSAPNATTIVLHLNKAYNPGYFLNNQLQDTNDGVYPLPSTAWNVNSAGGQHLTNWSDPAVAKKIYDYLNKLGGRSRSSPTRCGRSSMARSRWVSLQHHQQLLRADAEPEVRRLAEAEGHADPDVNTYTSFTAELNAVKSGSLDVMVGFDPSQIPQIPSLKCDGILRLRWSRSGAGSVASFNFKNTTNHFDKVIAQLYVRQALAVSDQPAGDHQGRLQGRGGARLRPGAVGAVVAVLADERDQRRRTRTTRRRRLSLLKAHGWKVVPNGTDDLRKPGTANERVRRRHPEGHADQVRLGQPARVGLQRPARSSPRRSPRRPSRRRHQHHAADQDVQLPDLQLQQREPGRSEVRQRLGRQQLRRHLHRLLPDRRTASGTRRRGSQHRRYSDPTATKLMQESVFGRTRAP